MDRVIRERDRHDYRMSIAFLGVFRAGKTSLFQRLFNQSFGNNSYRMSMMYWNHFYCSVDNKRIQLYIEDTAGCERFGFIPPVYYSRANGIVFVFDVCDRQSLLQIDRFLEQVNQNSRGFVVKMLVGNKIDSPNRQVSEEQGKAFAAERNMLYIEASAKEDINVDKIFTTLARQILYQSNDPKNARFFIESEPLQKPDKRRTCF